MCGVALKPLIDIKVIELLRPQEARVSLPLHESLIFGQHARLKLGIELVRFGAALEQNLIEISERELRVKRCGRAARIDEAQV